MAAVRTFFVLLALVGIFFVVVYNKLVRMRNRAESAWAQIDVELKRRYDLVPNLVAAVKGYAKHEHDTLDEVAEARSHAAGARTVGEQSSADSVLSAALGRLFAVAESYPELKASDNFRTLQGELWEIEQRIATMRELYNEAVRDYDTARETFPTTFAAWFMSFEPLPYFQVDDSAREAPHVDAAPSSASA